jgi:hypothetical protein
MHGTATYGTISWPPDLAPPDLAQPGHMHGKPGMAWHHDLLMLAHHLALGHTATMAARAPLVAHMALPWPWGGSLQRLWRADMALEGLRGGSPQAGSPQRLTS